MAHMNRCLKSTPIRWLRRAVCRKGQIWDCGLCMQADVRSVKANVCCLTALEALSQVLIWLLPPPVIQLFMSGGGIQIIISTLLEDIWEFPKIRGPTTNPRALIIGPSINRNSYIQRFSEPLGWGMWRHGHSLQIMLVPKPQVSFVEGCLRAMFAVPIL